MSKRDYLTTTSSNPNTTSVVVASPILPAHSMYDATAMNIFRGNLRAALANQALTRTTELARYSEQCIREAPLGENAYRAIVNAYALRAALIISGGEV